MKVVLISTYELGRQPFGLASAAAWLKVRGHEVECADLATGGFPQQAISEAGLIAFYLPMHTATRLAAPVIKRARALNPGARICCFGLYAPLNETYLRGLDVQDIIGGEFEQALCDVAAGAGLPNSLISLDRLQFIPPERTGLPVLGRYAKLRVNGDARLVGYTEASRGCKHLCRHCPIVPVYNGAFRIVQPEVVMADIRQQVEAGATHITFGDPDFLNGPRHAIRLAQSLHREFPRVTYDVTVKIEHLLRHRALIPELKSTGCLFVTSAVESVDDAVLEKLDKHHTRADFLDVVRRFQKIGLTLQPTFLPFTPWTNLESYLDLLEVLREKGLVENVAPIQLAIRLLIPAGSRLLELSEVRALVAPFDESAMVYPWKHSDPRVDALSQELQQIVHAGEKLNQPRSLIFERIETAARHVTGAPALPKQPPMISRATIPYLTEPWYC